MNPEPAGSREIAKGEYDTADFAAVDLQRIESVCDEFETAWKAGQSSDLASCLAGFDGQLRSLLLAELLCLDIHYRMRKGQTPTRADYETRFPQATPVIDNVFRDERFSTGKRGAAIPDCDVELTDLSMTSRYQLQEFHARGGLGVVYVARDQEFGRNVAVKFARKSIDDAAAHHRMKREARITGRLTHPGIVPVYATGRHPDGNPCYVMQMVEGETLRHRIRLFHEQKPEPEKRIKYQGLEFRQLLGRFVAICNTVAYAHDQQVIHRDIKPNNIMLGRYGESFLLDWGLARSSAIDQNGSAEPPDDLSNDADTSVVADNIATLPGQRMGTPSYASPEQITGDVDRHDIRSDVYSLGATLYCLIVGRPPVDAEELTDLETASTLLRVKRPQEIDRSVPDQLDAICWKAMAFEPDERYESAKLFADDLERYLADEPVETLRESWNVKARRWGRKHPRTIAGIMAAVLVAMSSFAVSSWLLGQKNVELGRANTSLKQSNSELKEARDAAQAAGDSTMAALRTLSEHVVQNFLARKQFLTDQDREFLRQVMLRYQAFADSQSADVRSRMIQTEAFYKVGQIQNLLGRTTEALESWKKAIEFSTPMPNDASPEFRDLAARCHGNYGTLLTFLGKHEPGMAKARYAIIQFQQLTREFPNRPLYMHRLVGARNKLGLAYLEQRQVDQAIAEYRACIEGSRELVEHHPENEHYLYTHAIHFNNLGNALAEANDHESAIPNFEAAIAQHLHRFTIAPEPEPYMVMALAKAYSNLGRSQGRLKRFSPAKSNLETAISKTSQLVDAYPKVPEYSYARSLAHQFLAEILRATGLSVESASEYQHAMSDAKQAANLSPIVPRYAQAVFVSQLNLALALRMQGEFAQAHEAYTECLQLGRNKFDADPHLRNRVDYARTYFALGMLKKKTNEYEKALEHFQHAVNLLVSAPLEQHEHPSLKSLLHQTYWQIASHLMNISKTAAALEYWDLVIENGPENNYRAQTIRAVCLAGIQPVKALQEVQQLLDDGVSDPTEVFNLACAAARAASLLKNSDQREAAESQSLQLLIKAMELGFFRTQARKQALKSNPSFAAMKDDEQFKKILEQLDD